MARGKKKVAKPKGGRCSQCKHEGLDFFDDGTGKCPKCGHTFVWNKEVALIHKPSGGVCSKCRHHGLEFFNDGTGKCPNCGYAFPWRRDLREKKAKEEGAAPAAGQPVAQPEQAMAPASQQQTPAAQPQPQPYPAPQPAPMTPGPAVPDPAMSAPQHPAGH